MTQLREARPATTGRPWTLTARLTATVVVLVALVLLATGVATTLVTRATLTDRLDEDVAAALGRVVASPPGTPEGNVRFDPRNQAPGTLVAVLGDGGGEGVVLGDRPGESEPLDADEIAALASAAASGRGQGDGRGEQERQDDVRGVALRGLGEYRVVAEQVGQYVVVVGLPSDDVDGALQTLLWAQVLLVALALAVAGGAAVVVVRRQLASLREVAATAHRVSELPLAAGEIELADRVPVRLTDERTEVGQVGAALNAMLDHVESSLATRQRSEEQVRQFVADASHELRTPLATIAGYTELARRQPTSTPTALAKVETEAARMTALVEDLLLLARLDAGRPLEREPVDLSLLLLEAVNDARVVDPDRSWRAVLPEDPITVTGDAARLHQVVANLLANARRHTPPGTTVTVTGAPDGFTVHDDGPGFAPDLVDHAFDRFTRGAAGRDRPGGPGGPADPAGSGGAGLGLSLVRAIVGAHGGEVTLTSRPGDTVLRVRLG